MVLINGNKSIIQQTNDERPKAQGVTVLQNSHQQQGNKNVESGRTQNPVNSGLTKAMTTMDEFKCGFPSEGLSTTSSKWWGNSGRGDNVRVNANGAKSQVEEKAGEADKVTHEPGQAEKHENPHGFFLLRGVRKRAAEEGREALKLGVFRGYGANKLSKREKILLHKIFGSSLPLSWMDA
ncbi:hypothetical protein Fmac_026908 [Flemingia macrophylla]|uniref:Uncharacterized protein n=1 Tax=Flemingia macrophylla TaxID=520843 RepID=A0ABD1LG76_9FABA